LFQGKVPRPIINPEDSNQARRTSYRIVDKPEIRNIYLPEVDLILALCSFYRSSVGCKYFSSVFERSEI
jgi:hypothetical protein